MVSVFPVEDMTVVVVEEDEEWLVEIWSGGCFVVTGEKADIEVEMSLLEDEVVSLAVEEVCDVGSALLSSLAASVAVLLGLELTANTDISVIPNSSLNTSWSVPVTPSLAPSLAAVAMEAVAGLGFEECPEEPTAVCELLPGVQGGDTT